MIKNHNFKDLMWVDLESPTTEELEKIGSEYNINPLIVSELSRPSDRTKVDLYKNSIYLILKFPKHAMGAGKTESTEIDFVVGKNYLITTHYDTVNSMVKFSKIFETNSLLNKLNLENGGHIFFYLTKKIYEEMEEELAIIGEKLQDTESMVFGDNGTEALERLSKLNKELIDFRRTMRTHKEVFRSFEKAAVEFFGREISFYTTNILGSYERVWHLLVSNKEILMDLRQTSDSLFTAKTNSVVRTLTVLTFITIPLSIIATFGQNAVHTPLVGRDNDFWIIIGLMIFTAFTMFTVFKNKKWL